jgi:hypothetical protein
VKQISDSCQQAVSMLSYYVRYGQEYWQASEIYSGLEDLSVRASTERHAL